MINKFCRTYFRTLACRGGQRVPYSNRIAIRLIQAYQLFLSPYLGQQCRFYPTCSNYACEAFEQHHFFKACYLTISRLWRCQPFYSGGLDPVPVKPLIKKYHRRDHHGL